MASRFYNIPVVLLLVSMMAVFCKAVTVEDIKSNLNEYDTYFSKEIKKLRTEVDNLKDNAAFSVYYSETAALNTKNMVNGDTYIFDQVVTNNGNVYSTSTGQFTAPRSGLYAFTWTFCADARFKRTTTGEYGEFGSELVVGGSVYGKLHVDTEVKNNDAWSTAFVIVNVEGGKTVYLRHIYDHQGALLSKEIQTRTTFSGWKI